MTNESEQRWGQVKNKMQKKVLHLNNKWKRKLPQKVAGWGETWIPWKKNHTLSPPLTETTLFRAERKDKGHATLAGEVELAAFPLTAMQLSIRDAWKLLIESRTKANVLFTVGFKMNCGNEEAINSFNFYWKAINKKLFNHSYDRDRSVGLHGLCVCEPHMLSLDFYGQIHFHFLVDNVQNIDTFEAVAKEALKSVVTRGSEQMLGEDTVDVRPIHNLKELADYLTKTARLHTWRRLDNICFLEGDGLKGIGLNYHRNARNY